MQKWKFYVPSVLKNWQIYRNPTDPVAAVQKKKENQRNSKWIAKWTWRQSNQKPSRQTGEFKWMLINRMMDKRQEIIKVLQEYDHMWYGCLGRIGRAKHRIELTLTDIRPINSALYPAVPKTREFEKTWITEIFRTNVIESAQSEWASPILFAPKKDVSLRFRVNYPKLNAFTVRDAYTIPRLFEYINWLGEARIFLTLNANPGYWPI